VGRNPKIMQFFMETTETNTEIRYKEGENTGDTYVTDDVTFGYIPEGMQMVKSIKEEHALSLEFQKNNEKFLFRMMQRKLVSNLDTQVANMEKIRIHNMNGYFQEKNGNSCVKWYTEEHVYTLLGNVESKEIIKIAENIQ